MTNKIRRLTLTLKLKAAMWLMKSAQRDAEHLEDSMLSQETRRRQE